VRPVNRNLHPFPGGQAYVVASLALHCGQQLPFFGVQIEDHRTGWLNIHPCFAQARRTLQRFRMISQALSAPGQIEAQEYAAGEVGFQNPGQLCEKIRSVRYRIFHLGSVGHVGHTESQLQVADKDEQEKCFFPVAATKGPSLPAELLPENTPESALEQALVAI
jgi:hypothetical protein